MVLLLIGLLLFLPGKTYRLLPDNSLSSVSMASACLVSGTTCSVFIFMRAAGMIQRAFSRPSSAHSAPISSWCEQDVRQQLHGEAGFACHLFRHTWRSPVASRAVPLGARLLD